MNNDDKDRMGVFAPDGSPRSDRLIEETEHAIRNSKAFLEKLHESEEATRRYVENIKTHFENDLRHLTREKNGPDDRTKK